MCMREKHTADEAFFVAAIDRTMAELRTAKDKQGNTCCHIAATVGHVDVLALLHEQGADMTAGTAKEAQWSPYHSACLYGKLDCMRYLHEHGFSEATDGQYPVLQTAYRQSYLNIVKFLVQSSQLTTFGLGTVFDVANGPVIQHGNILAAVCISIS